MDDLLLISIVVGFFTLMAGLAWLCQRLMEG